MSCSQKVEIYWANVMKTKSKFCACLPVDFYRETEYNSEFDSNFEQKASQAA